MTDKIIDIINAIRDSDSYIKYIYTMGGCYSFYKILKALDDTAIPYIEKEKENHIVTKIGERMYDIYGLVDNVDRYKPLPESLIKSVEEWSFSRSQMLSVKECPFCKEPIPIEL